MNLGENIYRLRTEKNMSQGDLADALDVSRQSVSKWENNSATPELDKLLKMSGLFGVSLDELVGKTAPGQDKTTSAPASPPVQQVIIQTQFRPVSVRNVIGAILICAGLFFLPLALSATARRAEVSCFILSAAFMLCGYSVLIFRYPYILCGWIALGACALHLFLLTHWEEMYFLLLLLGVFLLCMLWWTVVSHRQGKIRIPMWLWWVGGFVLAGLLILFCMNFVPPFWVSETSHTAAPN